MAVDPSVRIDIAAEFTGKKAFAQADKSTDKLTKNVKKLAGTFGIAFSARAVVNFSKQAIKAFAEDDAAITVLRQNLKNLGLAYQSVNAENFIGKLEQQTGILDDQLRPAYAQLSKVTLSTTKTQELMALAVDLARANGLDFTTVINTLSRAYVGNYKGLKQLNTGLTDAELATKDFAEIQAILIKQSQGANKAYIETFAGSIDKLAVASANAKEVIGEGLVDLFADMAGNGDIDAATANVNKFATAVSDLLKDVSEYNLLDFVSAFVTGNVTEGTASKLVKRPSARRFFTGGSGVSSDLLAARAAAAKLKADKAAAAAKIKADKLAAANKAKLEKAAAVFEIQKIQIAAALKGKISEEEKTRLLLMQAIEEGNADKAEALAKKLEEIQAKNAKIAADILAIGEATDPFAAWVTSLDAAALILGKMPALLDATGSLTGRGKVTLPTGDGLPGGSTSIYTPNMTASEIADTATAAADMAVAAAEAAVAAVLASDPIVAAIVEAANAGNGGAVSGGTSIFESSETIEDILTKVENAAAGAALAAEAAVASVAETQVTVDALAAATTNSMPTAGMNFNPYQNRDRNYDSGYSNAPTIIVNNNGSVIMQDEFIDVVNDAVLASQRFGYGRTPAGAIL